MGKMIYTSEKCKNPKKKPGWREVEAQNAEWLAKINSMTLFSQKQKYGGATVIKGKKVDVVKDGNLPLEAAKSPGLLPARYVAGAGTKPVIRPEIMYKDNPELLAREIKARERKFNAAPAYNKGPDTFVTEEELQRQLSGNKRRS